VPSGEVQVQVWRRYLALSVLPRPFPKPRLSFLTTLTVMASRIAATALRASSAL
jgi:hypothetical protein